MENASKALIIAGAILISIVLVSVGVIVVQSLNPDDALSSMDQQAIDTFNSRFTSVEGTNVRGTVVKNMLANVITSNGNNEEAKQIYISPDANLKVTVTSESVKAGTETLNGTKSSTDISKLRNAVNTSHRYSVELRYGDGGIVKVIIIKDNNATTTPA